MTLLELAGGVPALHPERKGMLNKSPLKNWVEKHGGLPTYINSVATALLREHPEWGISRIVATAVNWAKKTCATGKAFGGTVSVSKAVQAAACTAVAQWEKKKAAASEPYDDLLLELVDGKEWEDGQPEWVKHLYLRKHLRNNGVTDIPGKIELSDELFMLCQYEIELTNEEFEFASLTSEGEGVNDLSLDPERFMQLAENAAYSEAIVRFPVIELASAAEKVGDDLYEKVIVRNAIVKDTKGNRVYLDSAFMKALKRNYDELAATGEYVPLQFVKDNNKHTDDPRYYGGEVVKMELDDDDNPTCIKATFKLGEDAKKVVDAQPKVGVSIGAQYELDVATGKPRNPFLKHIALAHRVQVKNMGNWGKLIAASDYGEALTLDLTDADIEIINDNKEGGQDMAENGKLELTPEMLQEILGSDEVKTAIESQVTEATSTLRTENENLRGRLGNVESKSFTQAVEAAVDSYAHKGVPKIARDLVQGLLLTFGQDGDDAPEIELTTVTTTGEGDEKTETKEQLKLSRYEAAIRLLEEFEGFVKLTGEQGSSEEVELSENGELQGDARKNAIAYLTGKARSNNSQ